MSSNRVWIVNCEAGGRKMNWGENSIAQVALTKATPMVLRENDKIRQDLVFKEKNQKRLPGF